MGYRNYAILSSLVEKMSDVEIAKLFNVTLTTIFNWRKKLDIKTNYPVLHRTYDLDVDFFKNINTSDKAYILGFIASDGYIHKSLKYCCIAISEKDAEHLEKIRSAMKSNVPIKTKKQSSSGYAPNSVKKEICFCSKSMVNDLLQLGITPKKSLTIDMPKINHDLQKDFIRGVFDGDGYVGKHQFILVGNENFLNSINKVIFNHTTQKLSMTYSNNYPRLIGYRRNKLVLNWIYGDSLFCLSRKYTSYLQYWT